MEILIVFIVTLFIIAGFAYSGMWVMYFYYDESIFKTFKNQQFWDPRLSHTNKFKNGDRKQGPAFPGATTWRVAQTDGFHMLQEIALWALFINFGFLSFLLNVESNLWKCMLTPIAVKLMFGFGWWIGFDHVWHKK